MKNPLSSVYHFLRRTGKAAYAISTFYKYTRILGLGMFSGEYCRLDKVGIRASAPGEIIHADITEYKINGTSKAYIFAVIDNFSRKILSYAIMERKDTKTCLAKISEALKLCKTDCKILTDNGSEYAPLDYPHHLIAQTDINFSNSMIEAFFKTLKHGYLYRFQIASFERLKELVHFAVEDYKNRPNHALAGASPEEVFHNIYLPPDPDELLQIRQARIAENKRKCCFK